MFNFFKSLFHKKTKTYTRTELAKMLRPELQSICLNLGIKDCKRLKKKELIDLLVAIN